MSASLWFLIYSASSKFPAIIATYRNVKELQLIHCHHLSNWKLRMWHYWQSSYKYIFISQCGVTAHYFYSAATTHNTFPKQCWEWILGLLYAAPPGPQCPVYMERCDQGWLKRLLEELQLSELWQSKPAANITTPSPKLWDLQMCGGCYRSKLGETYRRYYFPLMVPASLLTWAMKTGATMRCSWVTREELPRTTSTQYH